MLAAKEIIKAKSKLNAHLASYTGNPVEKIEKDTDRDYTMSTQEALSYGIIDRIGYPNK